MVTMLEGCATKEHRSVMGLFFLFCGQEVLTANNIHKEMFPIYGGKCLSHKAVHNWAEKLPPWWQMFY
jgi:hypothetical protein